MNETLKGIVKELGETIHMGDTHICIEVVSHFDALLESIGAVYPSSPEVDAYDKARREELGVLGCYDATVAATPKGVR